MSRQKKKTTRKKGNNGFIGFVDVYLTAEHKKTITAGWKGELTPIQWIEDCVDRNYSIKFAWDSYGKCYRVTQYGLDGSENAGYGMASYAKTVEKALLVAQFKDDHMFGGGKWEVSDEDEDDAFG